MKASPEPRPSVPGTSWELSKQIRSSTFPWSSPVLMALKSRSIETVVQPGSINLHFVLKIHGNDTNLFPFLRVAVEEIVGSLQQTTLGLPWCLKFRSFLEISQP